MSSILQEVSSILQEVSSILHEVSRMLHEVLLLVMIPPTLGPNVNEVAKFMVSLLVLGRTTMSMLVGVE